MPRTQPGVVRTWLGRGWADIKASTDASLLGLLRFLGLLYGPIDTQLPIDQAFRKALRNRLPRNADWRRSFGGITYLLFILLVASGVLLSFYYRPSAEEAYQSVQHIVGGISLGWLMRDMHRWCANLIVIAVLVHMGRVFFSGAYKPPRETNWLIGLFLMFTILFFGATGYLLPWDQWAYWTTTQGIDAVSRVPLFGGFVAEIMRGDPIVSGATLSRFFAIHVIILPWIALGLLMLHFTLLRKHAVVVPERERDGVPFFPHHFFRVVIVGVLVIAFAMTAAVLWPRAVAAPADPSHPPASLGSTWLVADVSHALAHYLGAFGFVLFILLGIGLAVLPLFDRSTDRTLRQRPLAAGLGFAFFLLFAAAWLAGRHLRTTPSSRELVPTRTSVMPHDPTKTAATVQ